MLISTTTVEGSTTVEVLSREIDERELEDLRSRRDHASTMLHFYRARGREDAVRAWSSQLREYRGRIRALTPQTYS